MADLKTKDTGELKELVREFRVRYGRLAFERQAKTLKKSSELGSVKRDIARMLTIINERTK